MASGESSILSKSKCIMCQQNKLDTIEKDYTILKQFIDVGEMMCDSWPIEIS